MKKRQRLRNRRINDWEQSDSKSEHGVAFLNALDVFGHKVESEMSTENSDDLYLYLLPDLNCHQ